MDFFSQLKQKQTQTQKIQNQTQHTHNTNTTCFKIQEHKPMNLFSFNKTNPTPTQKHKLRNTKEQAQEHKPI